MSRQARWDRKNTTNEYKHIDIREFKKRGVLKEWELHLGTLTFRSGGRETWSLSYWIDMREPLRRFIKLKFSQSVNWGERIPYEHTIRITYTECYFWWMRYWFVCPHCMNRYTSLYLSSHGQFYCRKCLNLGYQSQLEGQFSRMWRMMWPTRAEEDEAYELYQTIKYPYRSWKETRKYKRYRKLMWYNISWQRRRAWMQLFNARMEKRNCSI